MGQPFNVRNINGIVHFNLTNRMDKEKEEKYTIKIDSEDFEKHVRATNCWFVHIGRQDDLPYVRRTLFPSNESYYLHWVVYGKRNRGKDSEFVIDHDNRDSLDNTSENLIEITRAYNGFRAAESYINNESLIYKGIRVTYIKTKGFYQSYFSPGTYIGASANLDKLKRKIDKFLSNKKE